MVAVVETIMFRLKIPALVATVKGWKRPKNTDDSLFVVGGLKLDWRLFQESHRPPSTVHLHMTTSLRHYRNADVLFMKHIRGFKKRTMPTFSSGD